jgi:hypothetical protein
MYAVSTLGERSEPAWNYLGTRRNVSPMSCKGLVKVLSRSGEGWAIFAWNGQESFVTSFKSSHILIYEKLKPISKIK